MKMRTGMGCVAIFLSVLYLIGFGVLGYGVWSAWRSTRSATWPTAHGIVTNIALKENSDSEGTTYQVHVEYDYT